MKKIFINIVEKICLVLFLNILNQPYSCRYRIRTQKITHCHKKTEVKDILLHLKPPFKAKINFILKYIEFFKSTKNSNCLIKKNLNMKVGVT